MTAVAAVAAGIVGLAVGSFLNVVAYRVPLHKSVVSPGSFCPSCRSPLAAWDNIPVVSWLVLGGRCRSCREPIAWRYPAVEAVTAALFVAVAVRFGAAAALPAFCVLMAGLVAVAVIDLEHMVVPRRLVYATLALGAPLLLAASAATGDWRRMAYAAAGGAIGFGAFLVIHLAVPRGMGFGDVRLAGLVGVFLGWLALAQVAVGLFLAFLVGSVVGVALIAAGRKGRSSRLPFAPFLVTGAVLAVLFGAPITRLWLG